MNNIDKKDLSSLMFSLEELTGQKDSLEMIGSLLNTPEDKFTLLAPGVIDSYLRGLNNSNVQLTLVQAINASGMTAEEMMSNLDKAADNLDNILKSYSAQKRDFVKTL